MSKFKKPKPIKLVRKSSLPCKSEGDGTIEVKPMMLYNPFQFYNTCGGYLNLYSKDCQYMFSPQGIPICAPRNLFVLTNSTGRVEFHQDQLFQTALLMLEAALSKPFEFEDLDDFKKGCKALLESKSRRPLLKDNSIQPYDVRNPCPLTDGERKIRTYCEEYKKNGPHNDMKTFQPEYKMQETLV